MKLAGLVAVVGLIFGAVAVGQFPKDPMAGILIGSIALLCFFIAAGTGRSE